MIQIPDNIQNRYKALLFKKAIPEKYHFHYMKWFGGLGSGVKRLLR